MNARDPARATMSYRRWIYGVFILAAGWSLAGSAFRSNRFFGRSTREADICQLDSFAEPALAEAVIQNEAERLLRVFIQTRALEQRANIKCLERLSTQVQQLKSDVDRKLLLIYSALELWNEFTDCYLQFLRDAPNDSYVVVWARCALIQAEQVGRVDEVTEALQQAVRDNRDMKTARGLQEVLEKWGAKRSQQVEAPTSAP